MKIRSLSVTIVGFILASSSFANPFLLSKEFNKQLAKGAADGNYTNFTGEWSGRCSYLPTQLFTVSIKNSKEYLVIDGFGYYIGGTSSLVRSKFATKELFGAIDNTQTSIHWNEDRSVLIMDDVFFNQIVQDDIGPIHNVSITHTSMVMENNKLIVKTSGQDAGAANKTDSNTEESVCTYTKD